MWTFQAMKKSSIHLSSILVLFLTSAQVARGTPFRHGGAHSAAEMRQRNKNWCAHVVHKNVSCAVVGGSESFTQPEFLPCPPEMINCAPQVIYRTHFRPTYKLDYKMVTELQWRCCPGYQGHDCMEVKSGTKLMERNSAPIAIGRDQTERMDHRANHPQQGSDAPHLEDEVQRLSQMVLDMQARITDMSSNLRQDFQEDASKMLSVLLGQMGQTASARGAEPRTVDLFSLDELGNKISLLESRSDTWNHLEERVNRHDGQIQHLMEEPSTNSDSNLRAYVDENIRALRKELMEGMDIKLADLKNSCDYKIMSMHHECEDQEENYLSLMELMDTKERELRQQIQELKTELEESRTRQVPDWVVDKLQELVNSSTAEQNLNRKQGEVLKDLMEKLILIEDRVSETKLQNPEADSFQSLKDTVKVLELGLCKANLSFLENGQKIVLEKIHGVEGRLLNLENRCGELKGQAGGPDDLDPHGATVVGDLRQLEVDECKKLLKEVAKDFQNRTADAEPPLMVPQNQLATESGEAGPPGRMTMSSKLPKGMHGSMSPVLGFAGAPAIPVKVTEPQLYTLPPISEAVAWHKDQKISFSAGLTLPLVHDKAGIIRFDAVLVNDGGYYNPETGFFTAPVDGRYLLSAILAAQPDTKLEASLSVDQHVIHMFGSRIGAVSEPCSSLCAPPSLTLVVPMKRGEQVALMLIAGKLATGQVRSSFSGVLLYPSSR
ncbi:EMILIN-2 isoform X2 [Corythoichthys intestinalis]|uniref:EMILIN-2 isoform X2 n=1 Tax=Corythoichthys intestinalis TaxID=161448 RepID=UPI0025A5B691|nr:EMILIN-2 isoform X2 [Corythoichthys intestinalis]